MARRFNLDIDALIDALAERVAERVREHSASADSQTVRPRLLDVKQAAAYMSRTEDAVRHLIQAGKLRTVRIGRRVFLDYQRPGTVDREQQDRRNLTREL